MAAGVCLFVVMSSHVIEEAVEIMKYLVTVVTPVTFTKGAVDQSLVVLLMHK